MIEFIMFNVIWRSLRVTRVENCNGGGSVCRQWYLILLRVCQRDKRGNKTSWIITFSVLYHLSGTFQENIHIRFLKRSSLAKIMYFFPVCFKPWLSPRSRWRFDVPDASELLAFRREVGSWGGRGEGLGVVEGLAKGMVEGMTNGRNAYAPVGVQWLSLGNTWRGRGPSDDLSRRARPKHHLLPRDALRHRVTATVSPSAEFQRRETIRRHFARFPDAGKPDRPAKQNE